jgi:hypothetical protein
MAARAASDFSSSFASPSHESRTMSYWLSESTVPHLDLSSPLADLKTIGISAPTGTSASTNRPFVSVRAVLTGRSVESSHDAHARPRSSGESGPFGTYTIAL